MVGPNRIISIAYLLVILSICSGMYGKNFRFHLPWACSVLYGQGHLIGACTIFDTNKVLVSVDNFNETVPGSSPPKTFYQNVAAGDIYVHVGSNYMNVDLLETKPKYAQKYKATKLYVVFKIGIHESEYMDQNPREWEIHSNPPNISSKAGAEFDVFGLSFNVGILEIQDSFAWSPYVQPVIITGPALGASTYQYSRELQRETIQRDACVTYSWSHKLNRIRYHEVMYLANSNCLDLFCKWKLSRCWEFPDKDYLKCFKSTRFVDVCPSARGAALYCPKFKNSVFAILTTAPSCGLRNMPGVYTTLLKVIEFYEKAYNTKFDHEKRPIYDLFSLQQRNDDYDGTP